MPETLRFSRRVPDSGVNLAWVQLPELDPTTNVSLVETARYVAENIPLVWNQPALAGTVGAADSSTGVSRQLYYTYYNTLPAPGASGTIAPGIASYAVYREQAATVSPSGFVLENFTAPIAVLPPRANDTGVWRLRVQDGLVIRRHVLRPGDKSWLSQVFNAGDQLVLYYTVTDACRIPVDNSSPGYEDGRIVTVSGVIAAVVGERNLLLRDPDLVEVLSLTVNGAEQITAASGQLSLLTPQLPPAGPFTAWDPVAGTLALARSVSPTDEVRVTYRYQAATLTYEGYLDDAGVYHDLELNPAPGHFYDGGRATAELLNIPIYLYLVPAAAYREQDQFGNVDQAQQLYCASRYTGQTLRWERTAAPIANGQPAAPLNPLRARSTYGFCFFDTAQLVSTLPPDNLAVTAAATGSQLVNMPSALVIAKLYVTGNAQVDNVQLLDTRLRGGGIPDGVDPTATALPGATRQQAEGYWNIGGWDGQPVPLAGVLLVEIPKGVLTGTDGYPLFTQDEIEAIVASHVSAGIRPIVRYV